MAQDIKRTPEQKAPAKPTPKPAQAAEDEGVSPPYRDAIDPSPEQADAGADRRAAEKKPAAARQERLARQARNKAEREARRAERQAQRQAKRSGAPKPARKKQQKPAPIAAPVAAPLPEDHSAFHPPLAPDALEPEQIHWQTAPSGPRPPFNILLVAQEGRLAREAAIFAISLRQYSPGWKGHLIVAEPQPEGAWHGRNTLIQPDARALLEAMGAEITPFTARHFGRDYPYGNKIEALSVLPEGQPFVFFDSDTLVTGPLDQVAFDFTRPSASMQREGSWPEPPLYGPGYTQIWRTLYNRFGLDFESSLDLGWPDEHWERYLYFNAGWFTGADPQAFGRKFLDYALAVRNDPGDTLASQSLDPWLDQVVLPLVIHGLGGGRPDAALDGLDGEVTCHYRNLSLLYARGSAAALSAYEMIAKMPKVRALMVKDQAFQELVVKGQGRARARMLFAGQAIPSREQAIRQALRREGLWFGRNKG